MKKAFFLLAALVMLVAPQLKADAFTNTFNFTITDSSGNALGFTLGPTDVTGISSNFPGGPAPGNPTGAILPGDIDVIFFGPHPITYNGTPDGFADLSFSVDAYDGSGHLAIGAPQGNLPWSGILWNAANTPVSGQEYLDSFVPGSYDVTIGSSTGVLTITNEPEPGMFASILPGLLFLGFIGIKGRLRSPL